MKSDWYDVSVYSLGVAVYAHPAEVRNSWTYPEELPMSLDTFRAALNSYRVGDSWWFQNVPRQLLIDLGVIRGDV